MNATCSTSSILNTPPPPAVCFPGDAFDTSTVNFEPLRERRREARYPTYEEVQVSLLDISALEVSGLLRDVSRSGLGLELVVPVTMGARLKVTIPGKVVIFATARYCRREEYTFHIGASIDAMFSPNALLVARAAGSNPGQPRDQRADASNSRALGGECRDLARAIIQDQELFPCASGELAAHKRAVSNRMV